MWKLDFSELNTDTSCYDSMMEVVLKSFGYEYQLYNLKKFSSNHLRYNKNNEPYITRGLDHNSIWKDLFLLSDKRTPKSEILNIHEYIRVKLTTNPIGIYADAFDCNWTLFYKRACMDHFFLIVDQKEYDSTYACVDIYYPNYGEIQLSFNDLEKICQGIYEFKFDNPPSDCLDDALCYLKKHVKVPDANKLEFEQHDFLRYC